MGSPHTRLLLRAFQVALGLSELGLSSCGTQQVYQRLEVRHTDLQDPQAITHCRHVQQLVLAGNRLTTLQPLGQLKHLTSLDVSHNRLTAVSVCSLLLWRCGNFQL